MSEVGRVIDRFEVMLFLL